MKSIDILNSSSQLQKTGIHSRRAIENKIAEAKDAIQIGIVHLISKINSLQPEEVPPPFTNDRLYSRSKIFVVHGHDEGAREGVARFLEKIGLEAIILREQPNRGRTIIEKFLDCAREVGFAVVLLTPHDLGRAVADEGQDSRAAKRHF